MPQIESPRCRPGSGDEATAGRRSSGSHARSARCARPSQRSRRRSHGGLTRRLSRLEAVCGHRSRRPFARLGRRGKRALRPARSATARATASSHPRSAGTRALCAAMSSPNWARSGSPTSRAPISSTSPTSSSPLGSARPASRSPSCRCGRSFDGPSRVASSRSTRAPVSSFPLYAGAANAMPRPMKPKRSLPMSPSATGRYGRRRCLPDCGWANCGRFASMMSTSQPA